MGFPRDFAMPDNDGNKPMTLPDYYSMFGNAVCPPVIAAIAGAVLDRASIGSSEVSCDWVQRGRQVAIDLAHRATLPRNPGKRRLVLDENVDDNVCKSC
jgi:C-5 cytosine-specific DNA methylase